MRRSLETKAELQEKLKKEQAELEDLRNKFCAAQASSGDRAAFRSVFRTSRSGAGQHETIRELLDEIRRARTVTAKISIQGSDLVDDLMELMSASLTEGGVRWSTGSGAGRSRLHRAC